MPKITTRQVQKIQSTPAKPYARPTATQQNTSNASKSSAEGRHHGFLLNKQLGQHILKNPLVVDEIIKKADIKSTDTILEVGPGTGNLTMKMLPLCKKLVAVEYDTRMAAELTKRVQAAPSNDTPLRKKLDIICGDFLKVELPYFDLCISNTPYQISAPLVEKLIAHRPLFRSSLLMFQREFALRLVAKAGDSLYCRLSVNVQLFAKVDHVMKISKNSFRPPPKVESSIVRITPMNPPPKVEFKEWDGLVRICFMRKNKTLSANFSVRNVLEIIELNYKTLAKSRGDMDVDVDASALVKKVLKSVNMMDKRAAKMELEDFMRLLVAFHEHGVHFA
jgi:18S rRNA (adenine1779-N6/adenine1780-N6)-dimethyltransferase